jgi:tRNA threonylcarbamoyladenosine modification (KEOPS) complex  Pcc1 subunit
MKRVDISIELEQPLPNIIVQSLQPELSNTTVPRTQINIIETNVGIKLTIEAENTNALRATLNSYLRWVNCIISTAETFKLKPGSKD